MTSFSSIDLARKPAGIGRLDRTMFLLVVLSYVFEGPLRWLLGSVGVGPAIYLRDVLPVLLFVRYIWHYFGSNGSVGLTVFLYYGSLTISLCIGLFRLDLPQTVFGAKIFAVLWLAPYFGSVIFSFGSSMAAIAAVLFVISSLGVYLNWYFGVWPWDSMVFDTGFGEVSLVKRWWIEGGVLRLAGFTRSSVNASSLILVFAALMLTDERRNRLATLLLMGFGAGAIYLTTSKTALPICILCYFCSGSLVPVAGRLRVTVMLGLLYSSICWPVIALLFSPKELWTVAPSLADRMFNMWPAAFDLLPWPGALLYGGGIGALGSAQLYSSAFGKFNAVDSLPLYLFGNLGLPGILILLVAVHNTSFRLKLREEKVQTLHMPLVIIAGLGYGLTGNVVEAPVLSTVFFAVLFKALNAKPY